MRVILFINLVTAQVLNFRQKAFVSTSVSSLGLQPHPQKVVNPSKPTLNTFSEGTTGAVGKRQCLVSFKRFLSLGLGRKFDSAWTVRRTVRGINPTTAWIESATKDMPPSPREEKDQSVRPCVCW